MLSHSFYLLSSLLVFGVFLSLLNDVEAKYDAKIVLLWLKLLLAQGKKRKMSLILSKKKKKRIKSTLKNVKSSRFLWWRHLSSHLCDAVKWKLCSINSPETGIKLASSDRITVSLAGVLPPETLGRSMRHCEDVADLKKQTARSTAQLTSRNLQASTNQRRGQTQVGCLTEHPH